MIFFEILFCEKMKRCMFFKYPSSGGKPAPSSSGGEARGLLRSARNDDEKRGESLESNIKIPANCCIDRQASRIYRVK